jgi:hypothetical protein
MKLKSRSLVLTTIIAVSAGWVVPASVHSADAPNDPMIAADACSAMLVPEGVICMVSPRTGQPVAVSEDCPMMMSAISILPGTDPFKEGISLSRGQICKRDPRTGLPIVVSRDRIKTLPPIKTSQQKAQSILAAATAPKDQAACVGMAVPAGMSCLVDPTTGRAKAYWNDCLNWIIPAGVACVVDPETGSAMTVAIPTEQTAVRSPKK